MSKETAFNPKLFASTAVHAKFLDANDADYSDDSADGIPSDDDQSTWAHCKRAANHIECCLDADSELCNRPPADGSPDHLALAHKHLGEALEQRARGGHRDLVSENSRHARVRFQAMT